MGVIDSAYFRVIFNQLKELKSLHVLEITFDLNREQEEEDSNESIYTTNLNLKELEITFTKPTELLKILMSSPNLITLYTSQISPNLIYFIRQEMKNLKFIFCQRYFENQQLSVVLYDPCDVSEIFDQESLDPLMRVPNITLMLQHLKQNDISSLKNVSFLWRSVLMSFTSKSTLSITERTQWLTESRKDRDHIEICSSYQGDLFDDILENIKPFSRNIKNLSIYRNFRGIASIRVEMPKLQHLSLVGLNMELQSLSPIIFKDLQSLSLSEYYMDAILSVFKKFKTRKLRLRNIYVKKGFKIKDLPINNHLMELDFVETKSRQLKISRILLDLMKSSPKVSIIHCYEIDLNFCSTIQYMKRSNIKIEYYNCEDVDIIKDYNEIEFRLSTSTCLDPLKRIPPEIHDLVFQHISKSDSKTKKFKLKLSEVSKDWYNFTSYCHKFLENIKYKIDVQQFDISHYKTSTRKYWIVEIINPGTKNLCEMINALERYSPSLREFTVNATKDVFNFFPCLSYTHLKDLRLECYGERFGVNKISKRFTCENLKILQLINFKLGKNAKCFKSFLMANKKLRQLNLRNCSGIVHLFTDDGFKTPEFRLLYLCLPIEKRVQKGSPVDENLVSFLLSQANDIFSIDLKHASVKIIETILNRFQHLRHLLFHDMNFDHSLNFSRREKIYRIALPFQTFNEIQFFLDKIWFVKILYIPNLTDETLSYLADRESMTPTSVFCGTISTQNIVITDNRFRHISVFECPDYPLLVNNVTKCRNIERKFLVDFGNKMF